MKISRPFIRLGELLLVHAELRGPRATISARLVFDTGAAATTLVPEFIEALGYSARDGGQPKRMHSALSEEDGYTLEVAELSQLRALRLQRFEYIGEVNDKLEPVALGKYALSFDAKGFRENASAMVLMVRAGALRSDRRQDSESDL